MKIGCDFYVKGALLTWEEFLVDGTPWQELYPYIKRRIYCYDYEYREEEI